MSLRIEGVGFDYEKGTFTGTVNHMIEHKLGIADRALRQQDLSPILNALETLGRAKRVGKFGAGFIWEIQLNGEFNLGVAGEV